MESNKSQINLNTSYSSDLADEAAFLIRRNIIRQRHKEWLHRLEGFIAGILASLIASCIFEWLNR